MSSRTDRSHVNRLGDFEIVREVGRGGMGIVYEARQLSLNRKVALKVLSTGLGLSSNAVQRFQREAESAARLHHTNIVPVYATGEQDGTHFYAMELIEGPALNQVVRELRDNQGVKPAAATGGTDVTGPYIENARTPSGDVSSVTSMSFGSETQYFDTVAKMIAAVAEALDYAHQQGVIHRDIKPSNLLLSPDGRLSVNDFGLARMLEQPGMTLTGEFVGTPAYMSPEQITAGRVPVDQRTDIYSLGATLYELLTLQPPFRGERREQVLAEILQKEPKPPRKLNRRMPIDLETICLKALDKDPDRRYANAGEMAADLRRFVNRFAIQARRAGPITRLRKWVKRHPGLAAALSCVVVLAGVASFAGYRAHRSEQELLAEKLDKSLLVAISGDLTAAEKAIQEAELAGASAGQVRLLRGQVACFRGDNEAAIEHLEQAVKLLPQSVAARGVLLVAYNHAEQLGERWVEVEKEMKQLAPITAEDFLLKGYALAWNSEEVEPGLALMDEAIRRRDSPMARLLRGEVRCLRAARTAEPVDAESALEDANRARGMLPDNPYAMAVSNFANLVAAGIYIEANQADKWRAALLQAEQDDRNLDRFPPSPNTIFFRTAYLHYVGRNDDALELLRRCHEKSNDHQTAFLFAVALAERGDFAQALDVLKRRPRKHDLAGDTLHAYILAELPNGPARAYDAYKDLAVRYQKPNWAPLDIKSVLLLLGRKQEALAECVAMRQIGDWSDDYWRAGVGKAWLDYNCGQISADEIVRAAQKFRWVLVMAHYDIALTKLAEGDRSGAREHFQKCLATRFFACWQIDWSRMFLARMEKDPTWPPWIPVK